MRPFVIVTGVLGTGTVLVFVLAGLVATLFPNGTLVNSGWNGGCINCGIGGGAIGAPMPVPIPAPGIPEKGIVIRNGVATDANGDAIGPTGTDNDVMPQP
jgi:hypothetical protein